MGGWVLGFTLGFSVLGGVGIIQVVCCCAVWFVVFWFGFGLGLLVGWVFDGLCVLFWWVGWVFGCLLFGIVVLRLRCFWISCLGLGLLVCVLLCSVLCFDLWGGFRVDLFCFV